MRDDEYRAMFDLEDHLWWYSGMRAVTESMLERSPRADRQTRLLDVGCGTGFSLKWLCARLECAEAFGIDPSPRAAELWRKQALGTVALASAVALPFASREFELVTCFDVIYQLNSEDARAAVSEMFRVLRAGGRLLIREPAYDWLRGSHDAAIGTKHRFTVGELERLLLAQGFTISRATYANMLLFPLALLHRLLSRIGGGQESDVKPVGRGLNRFFESVLRFEAGLLRRMRFPFGLSIVVLAEKE